MKISFFNLACTRIQARIIVVVVSKKTTTASSSQPTYTIESEISDCSSYWTWQENFLPAMQTFKITEQKKRQVGVFWSAAFMYNSLAKGFAFSRRAPLWILFFGNFANFFNWSFLSYSLASIKKILNMKKFCQKFRNFFNLFFLTWPSSWKILSVKKFCRKLWNSVNNILSLSHWRP
jgi:hypothetical protein